MLTKQDITVLSELLDQGLKPVREDLNRLHKDFEGLNNKFNRLRQDMNEKIEGLRTEMYQLIGDLREEMRPEISRLDNKIDTKIDGLREEMHSEISGLREEMHSEISGLREEMHRGFDEIHTILNTDISPRLKTIEDCYVKTFERYSESVERQKKMEEDISVMKDVIQEHSVQLQKLCG